MSKQKTVIFKLDCAASDNYTKMTDAHVMKNIKPYHGAPVTLPDNDKISPSHKGVLPLHHELSISSQTGTILPQLNLPLSSPLEKFATMIRM